MYLDFCIAVNELFALKLGQSVGLIHCWGKCFFGVLLQPWNIFRSRENCAYGSCSVCELSLAYCWLAVPAFVFVNSKRHVSSGHVPARSSLPPFQSRPHQITMSARQRPGLKHPFHACACTAANLNICHAYLYMYLQEIYVPRSHSAALSSVCRPQEQEPLRRPCRAATSSLRNRCDIRTPRMSLHFPTLISDPVGVG